MSISLDFQPVPPKQFANRVWIAHYGNHVYHIVASRIDTQFHAFHCLPPANPTPIARKKLLGKAIASCNVHLQNLLRS